MNLHDLVSHLVLDTNSSVRLFIPELVICATIVLMLLIRMTPARRNISSFAVLLVGSLVALALSGPWVGIERQEIFTGMLVYDGFTVYVRTILLLFAALFAVFTRLSGLPDREDGADIYTLVLGATLGMCIMASANHLLTVFLGVEMASVPSYALAAMLKGRRQSSEAALKYSIYGAGAAGVMLYGISLIGGMLNTLHLPTVAVELAEKLPTFSGEQQMILALAGLMIGVGLAFKLSAVPFHFWAPDVFEGASAEVNAFLSVASKAAALALVVRVVVGFGFVTGHHLPDPPKTAAVEVARGESALFAVADEPAADGKKTEEKKTEEKKEESKADEKTAASDTAPATAALTASVANKNLAPARGFIGKLAGLIAILTCTFGNLAAYGQTNIKRLFAYSTIAHAGYMLMAIPALTALVGYDVGAASRAVAGLAVYIFVYLFMNLGAFAIIAFWRNALRTEEISAYQGLIRRAPFTVICFTTILFSLIGLPPLAGFIGKLAVFAPLADAYRLSAEHGAPANYALIVLVLGSLNTALSLFYYLRVVKVMTIDPEPADRPPAEFSNVFLKGVFVATVTVPLVVLIFGWNWLYEWSLSAARQVFG